MIGAEEMDQGFSPATELGSQAFISILYSLSRNREGFPDLSRVSRTSRGLRVEFRSSISDVDGDRYIDFRVSHTLKQGSKTPNSSTANAGNNHHIRLMLDSWEFQISIEGNREISDKIMTIDQGKMIEYLGGAFPYPSFSCMSPFQRFLSMTHGLSVSSPVRRNMILDSSVAEMSMLSVDESRDEVRRSNAHTLSLMISSKTVIENAKGVHLPKSLSEFMKRYRTRFNPYIQRIRKSTIFDFEK